MSLVEAVAPGKLLLVGEYAVLDGAPALVMAVDRRVRVSIGAVVSRPGGLTAPQLGIDRARMRVEGKQLRCPGGAAERLGVTGRMIPAILRTLGCRPEALESLELRVDSAELFESSPARAGSRANGPIKLGLGSSAAVSAALAVGLDAWFRPDAREQGARELLRTWLPVYREALAARASGADLAAAFSGGLTEFLDAEHAASCRSVHWPEGLHWRAVWTGQAAQTSDFVGAYEAWKSTRPSAAKEMRARLGQLAQQAATSLHDGSMLVEACAAYADALVALGDAMGMEIMSAPHRRLADLARDFGVVYKSSGAGGGDLGIALAADPERIQAFARSAADHGGIPLNLSLSEFGAGAVRRRAPEADEQQ